MSTRYAVLNTKEIGNYEILRAFGAPKSLSKLNRQKLQNWWKKVKHSKSQQYIFFTYMF